MLLLAAFVSKAKAQNIKYVNDQQLDDILTQEKKAKSKLLIIDFYADWCGPCRIMNPILIDIAKNYGSKVLILKVDVDKSYRMYEKLELQSIPAFYFMNTRTQKEEIIIGSRSFGDFDQYVQKYIGTPSKK